MRRLVVAAVRVAAAAELMADQHRVPVWWISAALAVALVVYLTSYVVWRAGVTEAGDELAAKTFGLSSVPFTAGGTMAYISDEPLGNGLDYLFMPVSTLDRLITAHEFIRERDMP